MFESIVTLIVATAALLGSPGPATFSLAAVGAVGGWVRGLPYLGGILLGLLVVIIAAGTGLAGVFERWPTARLGVQLVGSAYLLYIAWKIASAPVISAGTDSAAETAGDARVPGMRDGFVLNILNPKAYAALLALFSQFLLPAGNAAQAFAATAAVCFVVAVAVDSAWLLAGGLLRATFRKPRTARRLRIGFALTIVAVTVWVVTTSMDANV